MNYLAHAYLSQKIPGVLTGNMISDFVKGKKKFNYPPDIQAGIQLHRWIDEFTDEHPSTKQINLLFKQAYGRYAGAFTDIVYDYFLANDPTEFSSNSLFDFSQFVYATLENRFDWLPEKFQLMFPYMKKHNWLFHYKDLQGIERSFEGLARRALYMHDSRMAYEIFVNNLSTIKPHYDHFFPEVKAFVIKRLFEQGIQ